MAVILTTIDTIYEMILFSVMRGILMFVGERNEVSHEEMVHDEGVSQIIPDEQKTFKTIQEILTSESYAPVEVGKNTIMYSGSIAVPVYLNPTIEFDSQITTIPYGEMVMMLEPRGRFFRIMWGNYEGWVLKEDLVDRAVRVYPEFKREQENSVDSSNTAHVRAIIGDIFGLGYSEFPLQAGEYVLYRLWKRGVRIVWPLIRPRIPGRWHSILKGVSNVRMGVAPRVGAVMEYMLSDDIGHLAYVEAVFPDDTITISEVNRTGEGIYNEQELRKEEWKELKPVFISFV